MFGVNQNGNNWKYILANFLVVFFAQLGWAAYENLVSRRLPTLFECYEMVIVAFVTTLGFYGINKLTHKGGKVT